MYFFIFFVEDFVYVIVFIFIIFFLGVDNKKICILQMYIFIKRVYVLYFEQIIEELVDFYCQKYEDQKKKFVVFFQLKIVLVLCIEVVVVLDRFCFLLEQVF